MELNPARLQSIYHFVIFSDFGLHLTSFSMMDTCRFLLFLRVWWLVHSWLRCSLLMQPENDVGASEKQIVWHLSTSLYLCISGCCSLIIGFSSVVELAPSTATISFNIFVSANPFCTVPTIRLCGISRKCTDVSLAIGQIYIQLNDQLYEAYFHNACVVWIRENVIFHWCICDLTLRFRVDHVRIYSSRSSFDTMQKIQTIASFEVPQ